MGLAPDINEMLARARADLRMGVPIVLSGTVSIVAVAAESLSDARLSDVLKLTEHLYWHSLEDVRKP